LSSLATWFTFTPTLLSSARRLNISIVHARSSGLSMALEVVESKARSAR